MYAFFECLMLLVLTALICTAVFAGSVVLLMVGEGVAAIVRISRTAANTATVGKVFDRAA